MKILLLEDDPNRVEEFQRRVEEFSERNHVQCELVHVETAKDCIHKLETDKFKLVLLDHDLGGQVYVDTNNTNTGSEVARWMNKNPDKIKGVSIITHTFNPAGAKNIVALVPQCHYVPSIWNKDKFHKIIKAS